MTPIRGLLWRKGLLRAGLVSPVLILSACQTIAVPTAPAPRLAVNNGAETAEQQSAASASARAPSTTAAAPAMSYTVTRGSLKQSLAFNGKVVPSRTAQLAFRGSGLVTAVHVTQGQTVKQGDLLAEFAPD